MKSISSCQSRSCCVALARFLRTMGWSSKTSARRRAPPSSRLSSREHDPVARLAFRGEARSGARIRLVTKAELHKLIDELPDSAVEGAGVLLRGIIKGPIDPDQAWFWTPEWQEREQEAEAELARGAGVVYRSTEDFISHLESVPPAVSD